MSQIMLCEPEGAPCCIAEIVSTDKQGDGLLIQTDWDWPGVASTFGWSPCTGCPASCEGATDGTIDCDRRIADDMIRSARAWIEEHYGAVADDPGYFA